MPFVRADGINIYYQEEGNPKKPLVVLIAGLSRDHSIWNELISELSPYFHILTYDNRGAGQTDKPPGPYSAELLSFELEELIKSLQLPPAIVVGHSMGGFIAQYFAVRCPKRVAKLILCSSCAKQSQQAITYLKGRLESCRKQESIEKALTDVLPQVYSRQFLTPKRIQSLIQAAQSNPFPQPSYALEAQIIACISHDSSALLSAIKVPTLVITGSEDILMPPDSARLLASKIKGSQLALIEGAGHMIQTEAPQELARLIKQFGLETD